MQYEQKCRKTLAQYLPCYNANQKITRALCLNSIKLLQGSVHVPPTLNSPNHIQFQRKFYVQEQKNPNHNLLKEEPCYEQDVNSESNQ